MLNPFSPAKCQTLRRKYLGAFPSLEVRALSNDAFEPKLQGQSRFMYRILCSKILNALPYLWYLAMAAWSNALHASLSMNLKPWT